MFGLSALHTLLRVIGVAILASLHARYVGAYLGGEMAVFFVYKALRRDFRFVIAVEGAASWIGSVFHRLVCKLLVDFTALIHFR